ncbi:MAG TPA: nucleotidyltransferase domain-containing protein [Candidatus Methanoperedens sp.]
MNIYRLLSTRERVKILKFVLYKTGTFGVSDVSRELKLSKGLVSKFFDILIKEKVLRKLNKGFQVLDNLNTHAIKIFLNVESFNVNIFKKFKFIRAAGIYGSFAKGTNTEESDIDIWIIVDRTNEEDLAKLTNELKKKYVNIKPLYLTKEKIETLKREDAVFYHSLVFGSINVYGEEIETI